jgi:hypothetical protein
MNLSEQQKQAIREWVASGASLSDVQRNLKSEFGIAMTYIDVRLLVLDLGAAVKDKPEATPAKTMLAPQPRNEESGTTVDLDEEMSAGNEEMPLDDGMPEEQEGMGGGVTLTMDSLVVPGSMVSGTVTFSDGTKARWLIDQQGRFGIDPETQGYRPSPADMQEFQMQLRVELQRKGYM